MTTEQDLHDESEVAKLANWLATNYDHPRIRHAARMLLIMGNGHVTMTSTIARQHMEILRLNAVLGGPGSPAVLTYWNARMDAWEAGGCKGERPSDPA